MSAPVFEFKTSSRIRVNRTWRVRLPDGDEIDRDELAHRVRVQLQLGRCEPIDDDSEDSDALGLIEESITQFDPTTTPDPVHPYTVIGVLTDSRDPDGELLRFAKTYPVAGDFRVAEELARRENPTLAIAGVLPGEVALADVI